MLIFLDEVSEKGKNDYLPKKGFIQPFNFKPSTVKGSSSQTKKQAYGFTRSPLLSLFFLPYPIIPKMLFSGDFFDGLLCIELFVKTAQDTCLGFPNISTRKTVSQKNYFVHKLLELCI